MTKIKVAILGSTGSIGTQALEVVRENPECFEVVALASGGSTDASTQLFNAQIAEFLAPNFTASQVADRTALSARDGLERVASLADKANTGADIVLNGIAGNVGLESSLRAVQSGAKLALANKESLVVGGTLFRALARDAAKPTLNDPTLNDPTLNDPTLNDPTLNNEQTSIHSDLFDIISPVDSEHSAIWQVYDRPQRDRIDKLILTASGGPFRGKNIAELGDITPTQALKHPTWQMGPLVTINSATLMNKALELVEAVYLFGVSPDQVEVTVHPQSIVHSGLQYIDGASLLQTSPPSMKLPIGLAINSLTPNAQHMPSTVTQPLKWQNAFSLEFEPVDNATFPAINLARELLRECPLYLAAMNIFNERAVNQFLSGEIAFNKIIDCVRLGLDGFNPSDYAADTSNPTAEELLHLLSVL